MGFHQVFFTFKKEINSTRCSGATAQKAFLDIAIITKALTSPFFIGYSQYMKT